MGKDISMTIPAAGSAKRVDSQGFAYLLLGLTMVVWGGSFVAARSLLASDNTAVTVLTPTVLATLRFGLASFFFLPLLVTREWRGRRSRMSATRMSRADALILLGLGQMGIAAYFWLQYTGVRLTNAGIASILVVGLIPIATAITARARLGERLRLSHAVALIVGLTGVGIIVVQRGSVPGLSVSAGFTLGALCLIGDAMLFAVYSTLVRHLRNRFDPLTLTAGTTISGTLGLLTLSLVTGRLSAIGSLDGWQWVAVLYLALICSVLAYFCYNRALATIEAGRASSWVYLEPPVALVLGALLLGERITGASVVGGMIVAASVWIISRGT